MPSTQACRPTQPASSLGNFSNLRMLSSSTFEGACLHKPFLGTVHVIIASRSAAANILRTTYGIDIALQHDPLVKIAEDAMVSISEALLAGPFAVDLIPARE